MRFERQPGRPLDRRSRRATHDSQGPPWCRCSSPCRREPLPRDAVRRSILAPPPARGSGDTPPVWSDRVARSVVGRGPRPPVQLQFERQTRQPLDRRSRRATHDSRGRPGVVAVRRAGVSRSRWPCAVRFSHRLRLGGAATRPRCGATELLAPWLVEDRDRRCSCSSSVRPDSHSTADPDEPPTTPRGRPGAVAVRRAGVSRSRETPCAARFSHRLRLGGAATRPRCGATELLAPWLVEDRDRRCSCSSSVRPRQPLDRRSRRATHDSQGPPWCRCSSPCRREPLPLAVRRSTLAPPPARGSGDTPPVWRDRVAPTSCGGSRAAGALVGRSARSVIGRVGLTFERQVVVGVASTGAGAAASRCRNRFTRSSRIR
jgi:hypothetical protein